MVSYSEPKNFGWGKEVYLKALYSKVNQNVKKILT